MNGLEELGLLKMDILGLRNLTVIKKWDYPNSLGLFYSAMTQAAGWKPNEEEYILMGASAVVQEYNIHDYQYIKSMILIISVRFPSHNLYNNGMLSSV